MKRLTILLLWFAAVLPLAAQTSHRDSVLAQARYLKSIYRTDEAIELMSGLVQPGVMDEGVLAELADCHFQSGNLEDAAGTYGMLSLLRPDNILYQIRLMQISYRLKAYPQSIVAGQAVLRQDSIPAVVSYIGDAFRQMEQTDSALWYYRRALALKPRSEATLSKALGILEKAGVSYLNLPAPKDNDTLHAIDMFPTSFFVDSEGRILTRPVAGAYKDVENYTYHLESALAMLEE